MLEIKKIKCYTSKKSEKRGFIMKNVKRIMSFLLAFILLYGATFNCIYALSEEIEKGVKAGASAGEGAIITDIYNIVDFIDFANSVNSGVDYTGKTVTMHTHIDWDKALCGIKVGEETKILNIRTIGTIGTKGKPFKGIFDGNGYTIYNFINTSEDELNYSGLFGYCEGATIQNLTVEGQIFNNEINASVGMIVGYMNGGTIKNCHSIGEIYSNSPRSTLQNIVETIQTGNSYNNSQENVESMGYIGGIVGKVSGAVTIEGCINEAEVVVLRENSKAGGILGFAFYDEMTKLDIINCENWGTVKCKAFRPGEHILGGIVGQILQTDVKEDWRVNVIECANFADIGQDEKISVDGLKVVAASLMGNAEYTNTKQCYSYGTIKANTQASNNIWAFEEVELYCNMYFGETETFIKKESTSNSSTNNNTNEQPKETHIKYIWEGAKSIDSTLEGADNFDNINGGYYLKNSLKEINFADENLYTNIRDNVLKDLTDAVYECDDENKKITIRKKDLARVTSINANYKQIKDITGLSSFINLTEVDLMYNNISYIDELKKLKKIKEIHLGKNEIKDITPLKKLNNLEYMDMGTNKISSVSDTLEILAQSKTAKNMYINLNNNKITEDLSSFSDKFLEEEFHYTGQTLTYTTTTKEINIADMDFPIIWESQNNPTNTNCYIENDKVIIEDTTLSEASIETENATLTITCDIPVLPEEDTDEEINVNKIIVSSPEVDATTKTKIIDVANTEIVFEVYFNENVDLSAVTSTDAPTLKLKFVEHTIPNNMIIKSSQTEEDIETATFTEVDDDKKCLKYKYTTKTGDSGKISINEFTGTIGNKTVKNSCNLDKTIVLKLNNELVENLDISFKKDVSGQYYTIKPHAITFTGPDGNEIKYYYSSEFTKYNNIQIRLNDVKNVTHYLITEEDKEPEEDSNWVSYRNNFISHTLSEGDEIKKIYIWLKNENANEIKRLPYIEETTENGTVTINNGTIILDTTPPTLEIYEVEIADNENFENATTYSEEALKTQPTVKYKSGQFIKVKFKAVEENWKLNTNQGTGAVLFSNGKIFNGGSIAFDDKDDGGNVKSGPYYAEYIINTNQTAENNTFKGMPEDFCFEFKAGWITDLAGNWLPKQHSSVNFALDDESPKIQRTNVYLADGKTIGKAGDKLIIETKYTEDIVEDVASLPTLTISFGGENLQDLKATKKEGDKVTYVGVLTKEMYGEILGITIKGTVTDEIGNKTTFNNNEITINYAEDEEPIYVDNEVPVITIVQAGNNLTIVVKDDKELASII